jgi:hypothetical protein
LKNGNIAKRLPFIAGMENGTKQKKLQASLSLWKNCGKQLIL